jgi:hypothetical protein
MARISKEIQMRILTAIALSLVMVASASAQRGNVTAIDGTAKSFSCNWKKKDWTYKTTDMTTFRADKKKAAFTDLMVGQLVNVKFHLDGQDRVADRVVVVSKPAQ